MPTMNIATLQEVAEYLKVSKRTVTRLVRAGAIPQLNLPGHARFDLSEVERALKGAGAS